MMKAWKAEKTQEMQDITELQILAEEANIDRRT
jgi:hypothetical protein